MEVAENSNIAVNSLTWSSSNTNVATVNSNGLVTGVSEGDVTITASYYDEATNRTTYSQTTIEVVDQTGIKANKDYFIFNKLSKRLLSVKKNDGDTVPSIANFAAVGTLSDDEFTSSAWTQVAKWQIIDEGQGLYSLRNVHARNNNIVRCLDVSTNALDIYQYDGGGYLKFNICRQNSGGSLGFELEGKDDGGDFSDNTNDVNYYRGLYLITYNNMYLTSNSNGDVSMTNNISEGSYWSITESEHGNMNAFATECVDADFETVMNCTNIAGILGSIDIKMRYQSNSYINESAITIGNKLKNSQIFIYRGHGQPGMLEIRNRSNEVTGHFMVGTLSGYSGTNVSITETGTQNQNMTFEENSLASAKCVIYLGCCTGLDKNGYNLLEETYNRGAHFVLGTTCYIYNADAKYYFDEFANEIREHPNCTIQEALNVAKNKLIENGAGEEFEIIYIGDTTQKFKYSDFIFVED